MAAGIFPAAVENAMQITINFDLVQILGIAVIAWLAGNVGSLVGVIINGIFTPSLDGQRLWTVLGLFSVVGKMQLVKIIIAIIGASVAIAYWPDTPIKAASIICGALGLVFMLVVGRFSRS